MATPALSTPPGAAEQPPATVPVIPLPPVPSDEAAQALRQARWRRRQDRVLAGLGLPEACTALAILAMSPRLLLQPACLSFFFLGLTLWWLWRGQTAAETPVTFGRDVKRYGPLLLLFALWANLDSWFLLGPLLV